MKNPVNGPFIHAVNFVPYFVESQTVASRDVEDQFETISSR